MTSTARGSSTGIGRVCASCALIEAIQARWSAAPARASCAGSGDDAAVRPRRRRRRQSRPTRWSTARTSGSARAAARGRRPPRAGRARCPTSRRWAPSPARPTSRVVLPHALRTRTSLALHRGAEALAAACGITIAGGDLASGPGADDRGHRGRLGRRAGGVRRPRRRPAGRPRRRDRGRSAPPPPGSPCSRGARTARRSSTATCARSRGSRKAARSPPPARARCSTSPTAWPRRPAPCRGGGVQLELDAGALPLAPASADVAHALGIAPPELAATGGEDYELLFCAPESARGAVEAAGIVAGSASPRPACPASGGGEIRQRAVARLRALGPSGLRQEPAHDGVGDLVGVDRVASRSMRSRICSICILLDSLLRPNRRPVPVWYRIARAVM